MEFEPVERALESDAPLRAATAARDVSHDAAAEFDRDQAEPGSGEG